MVVGVILNILRKNSIAQFDHTNNEMAMVYYNYEWHSGKSMWNFAIANDEPMWCLESRRAQKLLIRYPYNIWSAIYLSNSK